MKVWFGGYTSHDSKGIYTANVEKNEDDIKLVDVKNIVEIDRPTYFQLVGDLLFTIIQNGDQSGIATYRIKDGKAKQLDTYFHEGAAPCYISVDSQKHLVFTANYHLATINVFSYDENGKLTFITNDTHEGHGPRAEQDQAHPHFFDETPAGNLVSCDLGIDAVDFYKLDGDKLKHLARYQMENGFGTRHLVFSPDGKTMYIVGELSSQVNVARLNENTWKFEDVATYKTIPDDFSDHNGAAAIRISKDGKFIYISNRGHDSITVFKVLDDGKLELVQRISVFGSFPRDFKWDKDEKYLVVANQNTNNATLYRRNSETGNLTPIQKDIPVPEATRVLFEED
ncbi:lactonase family protein [Lactobacillus paragasseri]|uniref:lactonase family protein n=1 Tax=Lactobacillus paragasseri TaxID=2107999 RepID=UPI00217F1974|nr:lactonase family protein [Lactobacillus paragasseri]UWI43956.1 lactonase family protein [Lactobacillus paragasseri]UWI45200.1 lactonase family protein [Lactobacillus paragasseri]